MVLVEIETSYGNALVAAEDEADFTEKMSRVTYAWKRLKSAECPGTMKKQPVEIEIELDFGDDTTS